MYPILGRARITCKSGSKSGQLTEIGGGTYTPVCTPRIRPYPANLQSLSDRWAKYAAESIDLTISPNDDMFVEGQLEYYLSVGASALEVISEAMLLSGKTEFARILDLPCGGGRVTRYLAKFFPDSVIFVSDIDKAKQAFCASQFGVQAADIPADFAGDPPHSFDVIFVGSLLTHFNRQRATDTLRYLIRALSEGGLLIFTAHGRFATMVAEKAGDLAPNTLVGYQGFGYQGDASYGASFMAPSWILSILQTFADARVLGHMEKGWVQFQDVFIEQKVSGWTSTTEAESELPIELERLRQIIVDREIQWKSRRALLGQLVKITIQIVKITILKGAHSLGLSVSVQVRGGELGRNAKFSFSDFNVVPHVPRAFPYRRSARA